jgi:hypothetical protein
LESYLTMLQSQDEATVDKANIVTTIVPRADVQDELAEGRYVVLCCNRPNEKSPHLLLRLLQIEVCTSHPARSPIPENCRRGSSDGRGGYV